MGRLFPLMMLLALAADAGGSEASFRGDIGKTISSTNRRASSAPADFFTYGLSAPIAAAQCTDAALVSDQANAITCTRASTAYCTKADGTMVSHAVNRCRIQSAGMLWEPAATNLALRSEELDNAGIWSTAGTTVSANTHAAPWGGTTMDTVTWATGRAHYQTMTFASTTGPFTFSTYGRAISGTHAAGLNIYCSVGGVTGCSCKRGDGSACTVTASATDCIADTTFSTTVDRFEITTSCAATTTLLAILNATAQGVTSGGHVFGGTQFENGKTFSTSYIPTAGTSATRTSETFATTLANSLDTAGCWAATVTYGAVHPGTHSWLSTNSESALGSTGATNINFSESSGTNISTLAVSSMLNASTTARAYWSGSTMGLVSGATSDTDPFSGHLGNGGPANVLDIAGSGSAPFHIRAIRANTSAAGCQ